MSDKNFFTGTVIRNYVQANGETSIGIASLADGTAILGNRVEVGGGSKAGGIGQLGSNGFIARNKIDGAGAHALRAIQWKEYKSNGNTFAWNDVSEFKAAAADILCVGNKNTFVGASCKLDDKGKANKMLISGTTTQVLSGHTHGSSRSNDQRKLQHKEGRPEKDPCKNPRHRRKPPRYDESQIDRRH